MSHQVTLSRDWWDLNIWLPILITRASVIDTRDKCETLHTQLLTRQSQCVSSCHCVPLAWLTCVLNRHHWCVRKQKAPKHERNFPNPQAVSGSLSRSHYVYHASTSTEQATPIRSLPPQRSPDNRWKSQMKLISFCLFRFFIFWLLK